VSGADLEPISLEPPTTAAAAPLRRADRPGRSRRALGIGTLIVAALVAIAALGTWKIVDQQRTIDRLHREVGAATHARLASSVAFCGTPPLRGIVEIVPTSASDRGGEVLGYLDGLPANVHVAATLFGTAAGDTTPWAEFATDARGFVALGGAPSFVAPARAAQLQGIRFLVTDPPPRVLGPEALRC
jgi:hypothetical protein